MRYFSTFTGIGGFELGIEKAYGIRNADGSEVIGSQTDPQGNKGQGLQPTQGENPSPAQGQDSQRTPMRADERPLCVGFSEIDRYASEVYKHKFPNHKAYGDIKLIRSYDLPDFDLLVGGFPCQAFSIAGKRRGFEDTRGTLFFEVARILKRKRPRHVLLENVKGLLSHDGGRTFKTIVATLAELGYAVEWQVLNAKNFGVPQNRERVYIVGHLGGFSGRQIFPIRDCNGSHLREITQGVSDAQRIYDPAGIAKSQKALGGGQGAKTGLYAVKRDHGIFKETKDEALCITKSYHKGFDNHGQRTGIAYVPEATKQGYAIAEEGDSINLSVLGSKTRRGRVGKGIAQTVDTGMHQHTLQGTTVRRLVPVECERLMGLPDQWTVEGINGLMSDTQRYKMCGNGVVTNVVEAIIRRLYA